MNLEALIRRVRLLANDRIKPYFWSDADVTDWLNEAQTEAAIRGRMLRVTAEANPSMCKIAVSAGVATHKLNPSIYEISHQSWLRDTERTPLKLVSREYLDRVLPEWRTADPDDPQYLIQDDHALQLVPVPATAGSLMLEGYRAPTPMASDADEPDMPALHHIYLVQWALHIGYSIPDADMFDPAKSQRAEAEFTRYFGTRPDVDLRQDTRNDEHHTVVAWL